MKDTTTSRILHSTEVNYVFLLLPWAHLIQRIYGLQVAGSPLYIDLISILFIQLLYNPTKHLFTPRQQTDHYIY
jgi:hypothetical protein